MAYQSFDGKGHSRSADKLQAIKLPPLAGKRFLDIGCNEGFFCVEAARQGASRVVGIDAEERYVLQARINCPQAEILHQTWDTLPNEQFDVIIMLSALHYEKRPRDLARRIYDRLAPDGIFVLEGGVVLQEAEQWVEINRPTGSVMYPTVGLLRDHILENFSVRLIGPSVDQSGDPLPRHVFHCYRKRTNFIIIPGVSRSGKTTMAYDFRKLGGLIVSMDEFLLENSRDHNRFSDKVFGDYLKTINSEFINVWVDEVRSDDMAKRVARFVFNSLPKESDVVMIEGYIFSNKLIVSALVDIMEREHCRAWYAEKLTRN